MDNGVCSLKGGVAPFFLDGAGGGVVGTTGFAGINEDDEVAGGADKGIVLAAGQKTLGTAPDSVFENVKMIRSPRTIASCAIEKRRRKL